MPSTLVQITGILATAPEGATLPESPAEPSHPIAIAPGEPTHPIALPPVEAGQLPTEEREKQFIVFWSRLTGFVLVPVGGLSGETLPVEPPTAAPKK